MKKQIVRLIVKRIKKEAAVGIKACCSDGEYFSDKHCTFIDELLELVTVLEEK
jgi:hypothetical protein